MKRTLWLITMMMAMTMATNVSAKETNWLKIVNSNEGSFVIYDTIPYRIPALAQAMNGDGEINIVDATIFVNIILGNN
jgi:hypothetical protein